MTEERFTYSNTFGWRSGAFLEVMNGLDKKNRKLKKQIKQHEEIISEQAIQLEYLQDENKQLIDVLNENEQLKKEIENLKDINTRCSNEYSYFKKRMMKLENANARLEEKNIELQERNDRQYDKLTHLWECIRNKDYETLQKEWEEIEEADKKLQEEWKCYND